MNALFRASLLGTSRVVWPPQVNRLTISYDSSLALAQLLVGLLAYQDVDRDAAARKRFIDGAAWLAERLRAGPRRDVPRNREITSALRPGLRRCAQALAIARRLPFDLDEAARRLAAARTARRPEDAVPVRASRVRERDLARFLPFCHLGVAIVAAELGVAELHLAPRGIPQQPHKLILNEDWPLAAVDAAERWRREVASPCLFEVRVRRL